MDFLALTNYYSMFVMIEILIDRIRCDEKNRARFERFFVEKKSGPDTFYFTREKSHQPFFS